MKYAILVFVTIFLLIGGGYFFANRQEDNKLYLETAKKRSQEINEINESYTKAYPSIMSPFFASLDGLSQESLSNEDEEWEKKIAKVQDDLLALTVTEEYKDLHLKSVIMLSLLVQSLDANQENFDRAMQEKEELEILLNEMQGAK